MHSEWKKTGVYKSKSVLQLFPFFHQKNGVRLKKIKTTPFTKQESLKINPLNLIVKSMNENYADEAKKSEIRDTIFTLFDLGLVCRVTQCKPLYPERVGRPLMHRNRGMG